MTVVDASAVVDLLVPQHPARRDFLAQELPEPTRPWLAPDVLVFEVFAVVRRHLLRSFLPEASASKALERLLRLPVELVPATRLLPAAWELRDRLAAADSLYAALALAASEALLTTDVRLARAAAEVGIETRTPA
ncbi:MAG: type II toxin-antitoxin system VapC family toxin [Actinomycetota bacterium]|nr:type II toxin-antitoxin system VapC family toxin [Actinomycetota bacterium]